MIVCSSPLQTITWRLQRPSQSVCCRCWIRRPNSPFAVLTCLWTTTQYTTDVAPKGKVNFGDIALIPLESGPATRNLRIRMTSSCAPLMVNVDGTRTRRQSHQEGGPSCSPGPGPSPLMSMQLAASPARLRCACRTRPRPADRVIRRRARRARARRWAALDSEMMPGLRSLSPLLEAALATCRGQGHLLSSRAGLEGTLARRNPGHSESLTGEYSQ